VVATLNPGLSMRNQDEGIVAPRAGSSSSPGVNLPRSGTHSGMSELPGMWSGPAMATGAGQWTGPGMTTNAGQARIPTRAASEPSGETSAPASGREPRAVTPLPIAPAIHGEASAPDSASLQLNPPRTALGMFGWLVLGALLFGGVGALVYVALGERGERQSQVKTNATDIQDDNARDTPPDPVPSKGSAAPVPAPEKAVTVDAGVESGSAAPEQGSAAEPDKTPDKTNQKTPTGGPVKKTVKPPTGKKNPVVAVADEKDPKALIKQGTALEQAGEWQQARGVWMKLEKLKGYQAEAIYKQAFAAFSGQDTDAAVQLAMRAASLPGGWKTKSKFLYGDALYRQRAYDRAKDIFIGLWKQTSGDDKATAQKKVAACNQKLGKPDADGLL